MYDHFCGPVGVAMCERLDIALYSASGYHFDEVHGHDLEHAISQHLRLVRADGTLHLWCRHRKGPLGGAAGCIILWRFYSLHLIIVYIYIIHTSLHIILIISSHCEGCPIPRVQARWADWTPGAARIEAELSSAEKNDSSTDARYATTSPTSSLAFLSVRDGQTAAPWSLQNTIWPLSPQYLRGGDWKCSIRVFTSNHIVSSKLQGKTLGALCIICRTVLASLACQWQMVVLRWGVEFVNTGIWNYVRYVIRLSRVGNAKKLLFQQTTVSLLYDTFLNHGLVRRSLICSYIFYSIPAAASSGFEYSFRRPTRSSPKQESFLRIWCFVKVMLADVVIRDGLPTEWKDQAVCILSDASGTLQSPLWISMFHLLTSIQSILPLKKLSKQINSIGT